MSDSVAWLAELTVYDPVLEDVKVLRFSSGLGHVTAPDETPADTWYDPRIKQPALMKRDLFQSGTTYGKSRVGFGDLVLLNADGALDGLADYGFDGRAITIRSGEPGAAYPSGFPVVLVGTMEQAELSVAEVRIKLRDRQFELQKPLQPTKYAGNNALPAGLEGVEDLKGKPKPVLYGKVQNISPPCVNTSKLIYQVAAVLSGVACNAVDMVYDRGIPLGRGYPVTLSASGVWATALGIGAAAAYDIAYGAGLWVVVGQNTTSGGPFILTSPDGVTWTPRTSNFTGTAYPIRVVFVNGVFIAGGTAHGAGDAQLSTSTDGITWTAQTTGYASGVINSIGYGNGLYLIGGSGQALYTSTNLTAWTSRTSGFTSLAVSSIAYGNGRWVIGGGDGTRFLRYSTNGTTGYTNVDNHPFSGTDGVITLTYERGYFIAATSTGKIATSVDGISWVQRYTGFENNPWMSFVATKFAYLNGRWIRPLSRGLFLESFDEGETWRSIKVATTEPGFIAIATEGSTFVAISSNQSALPGSAAAYASESELVDDSLAPMPGMYKSYPDGGYFRLGSSPAGQITADVTEGANAAARTAGQAFKKIIERAGFTTSDYSASDITALDTANDDTIGFYADSETTFERALDDVAQSVGAYWGPDKNGLIRIKQLTDTADTPVVELTANDLLKAPERIVTQDEGRGLPSFRSVVRYAKNWTVQTDLAGGVTDVRRAALAKEWREAAYTDASVQTKHPLAPEIIEDSLLLTEAAALAEATRRQGIRGVRKDRYIITIPLNSETELIDMGHTITLTHHRFGLSGGPSFRVLSLDPDAAARTVAVGLWGPLT